VGVHCAPGSSCMGSGGVRDLILGEGRMPGAWRKPHVSCTALLQAGSPRPAGGIVDSWRHSTPLLMPHRCRMCSSREGGKGGLQHAPHGLKHPGIG
jgi:hypothetical protein